MNEFKKAIAQALIEAWCRQNGQKCQKLVTIEYEEPNEEKKKKVA